MSLESLKSDDVEVASDGGRMTSSISEMSNRIRFRYNGLVLLKVEDECWCRNCCCRWVLWSDDDDDDDDDEGEEGVDNGNSCHRNRQFQRRDNPCKPAPPEGLTLECVYYDDGF